MTKPFRVPHRSRLSVPSRPASRLERVLRWFGVNADLAEQVLGDLTEDFDEVTERFGIGAARRDYARGLVGSLPHLMLNAIREGGPVERARLALAVAGLTLMVSFATSAALGTRRGPPARIFADHAAGAGRIVVNNEKPVQLPMRVVDAKERPVEDSIRYQWVSGAPLFVSSQGVVTCAENGDAVVRASAGTISTDLNVRCRPVKAIESASWITLIDGGEPQELPFKALGVDGRPVTELRGSLRIRDSTIANLSGAMIRPVSPGETELVITVGDQEKRMRVLVHERVAEFTKLRPNQLLVAVPIRLARGDTVSFGLPRGTYWLKYLPKRSGEPPPSIFSDVMCGSADPLRVTRVALGEVTTFCLILVDLSDVTLGHGLGGLPVVEGTLAVERVQRR